ncbi:MAG: class I SAM-dependent methyltransferase [Pseudomonadota bacterium]
MPNYDSYARFYDATQGPVVAYAYQHLLKKYHPRAKSLLEVACGTGAVLGQLAADYEIAAGLDISESMLQIARAKNPGIEFHQADMTRFRLDKVFDVAICPYDSINHLTRFSDWVKTFKSIRRHLRSRGLFVFDVNTEYGLREKIRSNPYVQEFDGGSFIVDVVDAGRGIAQFLLKVFERKQGDQYRLHQESINEVAFPLKQIRAKLDREFRYVHCFDASTGWSRPSKKSRRVYWVCRL